MSGEQASRRTFDKYESYGAYHWRECDRRSRTFNPPLVARYRVVVEEVGGASRILEVGAGDGRLSAFLAESGASVIGIEIDETAVGLASDALRTTDNCAIVRADCYRLPFASHQFDAVVMADVIEHLENPDAAVAEAARMLAPDGILVLTTPKWRPDRMWDIHHVREYTTAELTEQLSARFARVEIRYFWPLFWSNVYATRIGWRVLRTYARYFPNPFLKAGVREQSFGQILAVCRDPVVAAHHPGARRAD